MPQAARQGMKINLQFAAILTCRCQYGTFAWKKIKPGPGSGNSPASGFNMVFIFEKGLRLYSLSAHGEESMGNKTAKKLYLNHELIAEKIAAIEKAHAF